MTAADRKHKHSTTASANHLRLVSNRNCCGSYPLVTVLINNYNYGQFLRKAIESALCQTWKLREVIVVDDGSTDDSREIIHSFGRSIVPVLKENGGQASAFNAGFAASRGDIICFLDSDDIFLPGKLESLVKAWQEHPGAGLFYHRLRFIDGEGRRRRGSLPSSVIKGRIKGHVHRSGGWWPVATTSGMACSRAYLDKIFPMPMGPFRLCADAYVSGVAPFITEVVGIRDRLALYRLHGANNHSATSQSVASAKRQKNRYEIEFQQLKLALSNLSVTGPEISLEHHYPYQYCCWKADQSVSRWRVLTTALRTPTLPLGMKLKALWNTGFRSRLP